MKGSDNVWPKLIISEGTTPASPSAGQQKLFIDSADHKFKRVNSAGTVTTIEGGGGGGSSYPPGSFDPPPTVANAKDDEFDGTSLVTWTATPTAPAIWSVNADRANHVHIEATSTQAANFVGRYQAVPGAYPFTVTAKLAGYNTWKNFSAAGLFLAPATPTGASLITVLGPAFNSGSSNLAIRRQSNNFTNTGTYTETVGPASWVAPAYLRMVVNSATSVDFYSSVDGWSWVLIQAAYNPGFTPGVMGVCATYNTGSTVDAYFDFFRIT